MLTLFTHQGRCSICKQTCLNEQLMCANCLELLSNDASRCSLCLSLTLASGHCLWCLHHKQYLTLCVWVYHPCISAIIIPFKSNPNRTTATALARSLYEKARAHNLIFDVIIPIPSHWRRRIIRPINPANELAFALAKFMGCTVDCTSLKKIKNTKRQFGAERKTRLKQQKNSFSSKKIYVQRIALVDDVVTTGATIDAAIKALKRKNPRCQITILTLARADLE